MADTPETESPLRPHARPDGIAPDAVRPQLRPDKLGHVPEGTEANATVAEAIPLDRTTLIGLFTGPDGGRALLRLATGDIVKVAAGEMVSGGQVTAIDEETVRLERNGVEVVLSMPS